MESLLLFRRALTSPTMCRFIPALSVTRIFDGGSRQRAQPSSDRYLLDELKSLRLGCGPEEILGRPCFSYRSTV
jgi:hypothetical protein